MTLFTDIDDDRDSRLTRTSCLSQCAGWASPGSQWLVPTSSLRGTTVCVCEYNACVYGVRTCVCLLLYFFLTERDVLASSVQ